MRRQRSNSPLHSRSFSETDDVLLQHSDGIEAVVLLVLQQPPAVVVEGTT